MILLLIITATLLITYIVGTALADYVMRKKERKQREAREFLDMLLDYK
jgi:putative effector of murein hydrolase LrgA (UPF0299 family)